MEIVEKYLEVDLIELGDLSDRCVRGQRKEAVKDKYLINGI